MGREKIAKRIAWTSDLHLNFLKDQEIKSFCASILTYSPDALLISGDIGEAASIKDYLLMLENELKRPIYFVLGNHDYYHGSIAEVRKGIVELVNQSDWLNWLTSCGIVELSEKTCLIGHDSWADGRLGNYWQSDVMLNDYLLIEELKGLDPAARLKELNKLGDEAVNHFENIIDEAFICYQNIIATMHAPPFREACKHEGRIADDNWLPHFSSKALGDLLLKKMQSIPNSKMTVLCGHTHSFSSVDILSNLHVTTAAAEYGKPIVQDLLVIQ